jgi:pimeloyl-ACP methyl ester carboxylesterase
MKCRLVKTYTEDDIELSASFLDGNRKNKTAVILIHGFFTSFYTIGLFNFLQTRLNELGLANISVETRGSQIVSQFNTREETKIIGSTFEKLEEAHLDITAWIEYLKGRGYKRFVLLGHSLGTLKAIRYMFEGRYKDLVKKIILVGPFDKNGYIEDYTNGKWRQYLLQAKEKINLGHGREMIPDNFDDYQMSYQTYYSWYQPSDLNEIFDFYRSGEYEFPILNKLNVPVQIIFGDQDEFVYIDKYNNLSEVKQVLQKHIKLLDLKVINDAGHNLDNHFSSALNSIRKFLI